MPLTGVLITIAIVVMLQSPASQPPRDVRSPGVASASLAGRVVDDAGVPIAQAIVTVVGVQPGGARTAITDADGVFRFANLPAARVRLRASSQGYMDAQHGSDGAGQSSKPIGLEPGRQFEATLVLQRTAVITGLVTDDRGLPMRDIGVAAWHVDSAGQIASMASLLAVANADGVYRIWNLPPGVYAVGPWTGRGEEAPQTGSRVTLGPGETRTGIDVRYPPPVRPTGDVEGLVLGPDGRPVRQLRVHLFRSGAESPLRHSAAIDPHGAFMFRNVPGGAIRIAAHSGTAWAFAEVHVPGEGRVGVPPLTLRPGVTISGHIVTSGAEPPIVDVRHVFVGLVPLDMPASLMNSGAVRSHTKADGTFTIRNVPPGRYTIRVRGPIAGIPWTVETATLSGADVIEKPFEVGREPIDGVTITIAPAREP